MGRKRRERLTTFQTNWTCIAQVGVWGCVGGFEITGLGPSRAKEQRQVKVRLRTFHI